VVDCAVHVNYIFCFNSGSGCVVSFCTQPQAVQLLRIALTFKTLVFQVPMLLQVQLHITFKSLQAVRTFKLSCDSRFQRAFTACSCGFKVITLVRAHQRNFFENATACSKRMRKTLVATQLYIQNSSFEYYLIKNMLEQKSQKLCLILHKCKTILLPYKSCFINKIGKQCPPLNWITDN